MLAVYHSAQGQFDFTFESERQDEIFEQVAACQEVFEVPCTINKVDVPLSDIKFVMRQNEKEDKFYEQRYAGPNKDLWGFKREFHMRKSPKGSMYVHTYLKTDEDKKNYEDGGNGWRRWKGGKNGSTTTTTPTVEAGSNPGF